MDKEVVHLNRLYPMSTISRHIKKVTKAFWQYKHCKDVIVAVFACCVLLLLSWNNKRKPESDKLS